ncbi:MAG: hypothetical protein ACRCUT_12930, partial [Spirochaetota bacterium]
MKKKYAAAILLLPLMVLPTLQCGLLIDVAPMLLQGAYAMAVNGKATVVTRGGMRVTLTKDMKLTADNIILPGSRILAGPNSAIDLCFTDSIKVRLGANSSVTLDA